MMFSGSNVLVAGGAGFVGVNLKLFMWGGEGYTRIRFPTLVPFGSRILRFLAKCNMQNIK